MLNFQLTLSLLLKYPFTRSPLPLKGIRRILNLPFPFYLLKVWLNGGNFHFSYCLNAISYWLLLTRQYNQSLTYIMVSTFKTALWCRYHPYFTDKETQATKLSSQPKVSQLCNQDLNTSLQKQSQIWWEYHSFALISKEQKPPLVFPHTAKFGSQPNNLKSYRHRKREWAVSWAMKFLKWVRKPNGWKILMIL